MSKKLIRAATWIPILGIIFEIVHIAIFHENYMSEIDNQLLFHFSYIYHGTFTFWLLLILTCLM